MVEHAEFWDPPATRRNDRPRPLEAARCTLCGIELPKGLMMPDGGGACADIRWYCKDTKSCTERWTAKPADKPATAPDKPRAAPGKSRAAPDKPRAAADKPRAARDKQAESVPADAEPSQPTGWA